MQIYVTTRSTLLTTCSYGYKVVCSDSKYTKETVIYRGEDASEKLIESLIKEKEQIEDHLQHIEPMNMEDNIYFKTATRCCICSNICSHNEQRAAHLDHTTGSFIDAAHMHCNLQCKQPKLIPVIFHNLKHFDGHCLCKSIG